MGLSLKGPDAMKLAFNSATDLLGSRALDGIGGPEGNITSGPGNCFSSAQVGLFFLFLYKESRPNSGEGGAKLSVSRHPTTLNISAT